MYTLDPASGRAAGTGAVARKDAPGELGPPKRFMSQVTFCGNKKEDPPEGGPLSGFSRDD
jgi:hypothetical protein